uniref:CAZy families CE1 protein n=1 Tax=uncultured Paenibacillus sp. TaxID=227322 RepID=A0A060BVB6_9BACL|nr:CAZy families CE1 protein [uncultured Paenibacillus sp.]
MVLADKTALPTYYRLLKAGAKDVHITYYDHVQDRTGVYHDEDGRPTKYLGHCIWINVYNDETKTDIDGRYVLVDGRPVTLWQWVGLHRLS